MSKAVHVLRDPYDVYVGRAVPRKGLRASPWGNPFRIGRDGDRQTVIAKHRDWLLNSDAPPARYAREHLGELRGKRLACFCAPEPCHADTLAELANAEVPA